MRGPEQNGHEIVLHDAATGNGAVRVLCLESVDFDKQPESTSLVEAGELLRHNLITISIVAVLGVIGGVVLTLNQTPIYQAATTLEIQNSADSPIQRIGDFDLNAAAGVASESFVHTQVKILQSRGLVERVQAKMKTANQHRSFHNADRLAAWKKALGWKGAGNPDQSGGPPPIVIRVRYLEPSRIVELLCDSPDPAYAAEYVNAMTSQYIEDNIEGRWTAAQTASAWLTRQLDDLRKRLQKSEDQLQQYSRDSGLLFTSDKESVAEDRLKQLQAEVSKAEADRVLRQSAYEVATVNRPESVPEVIDDERLSDQQAKISEMRRQLAELSSTLTPAHYKVKRIQAQIDQMEVTLQNDRDAIMKRIKADYSAARIRERLLTSSYEAQSRVVSEQLNRQSSYNIFKQEVDTNRHLYDALLQKLKEFSIGSALKASNVRVVDPAVPPKKPYKPNLFRNLGMGLVSGMLLGVAFVLARDHIDRSLKGPGEASYHLKIPELGVIPSEDSLSGKSRQNATLGLSNGSDSAIPQTVELVTWQNKLSLVAESFRSTLASVLFSGQNGNRPKVILVTSPGYSEGKSTSASNLAIALAEIRQKVLLIDADMRRARQHTIFDLPNSWGLSDLLRERNAIKDSPLEALARKTEIEGLYLLPAGPGTVSISNLLYSSRMSELLNRFREEFDTVVIDTPPMLYVSDARVLGRTADAVILVVRSGQTTRDAALAAKQRFSNDGIPVLGVILNGWNLKSKTRYGYHDAYVYSGSNGDRPQS